MTTKTKDRSLGLSDLTRNQLTEMQIFAAYATVGAVKQLLSGEKYDTETLQACVDRYETYAAELRSRRTPDDEDFDWEDV